MTTKKFTVKHKIALASLLAALSLASQAELPEGEFACHVVTETGQSGLVLLQTDAKAGAMRAARAATAWEMDGGQGKAISVVECINIPDEKFKDSWFNSFYENFPL